jgi:hypothetical protein
MILVRHCHTAGSGLTDEQKAEIQAAAQLPITYDEDCPRLTDEQLAQFHPVGGITWEERRRRMDATGVVDSDAPSNELRKPAICTSR